jgi:hypothetical protein
MAPLAPTWPLLPFWIRQAIHLVSRPVSGLQAFKSSGIAFPNLINLCAKGLEIAKYT